jgi:hypothetical protein
MQIAPGREAPLGFFPDNLDRNGTGWTSQAYQIYASALNVGKRYHDQNVALQLAQTTKREPELPDVQARNQLARADAQHLAKLKAHMAAIDQQIREKESALVPFQYDGNMVDAARRQEMRQFMRGMSEEARREKMRTWQWRRAALETEPELSGLSESMHKALTDETLRAMYPNELAGINEGRQALQVLQTAVSTVEKAVDHELRSTGTTGTSGPPEESEPFCGQPGMDWSSPVNQLFGAGSEFV